MKPLLEVQKLNFTYPNGTQALDRLSFSVESGDFCALLGPNAAGKSTFFLLASALAQPNGGRIIVDGVDLMTESRRALSKMGFVFQQPTLDLDLTVVQNLSYFASLHGLSGQDAAYRIDRELDRLDLTDRRAEKVRQLNGGHRRRVEIARALLHQPAVLLLDEATVGLDIRTRHNLVEYVHRLSTEHQVGVLWATHLIDEIRPDDKVVILHQGQLVGCGSAQTLGKAGLEATFRQLTGENGETLSGLS